MLPQRTHHAVVTTALRAPLAVILVETVPPAADEVLVKVEYVASTPLNVHQVFGLGFREQKEKAYQELATFPEYLLGKRTALIEMQVPDGFKLQEAVTLPSNFVTVFHTVTKDLGIPLPWPPPHNATPDHAQNNFSIWGGSSSVGLFPLQILRYYGSRNLIAVASKANHELLLSLGSTPYIRPS
ncbi:MAG: hypothetical protein LQ340_006877 [Diploschistes diacapsis]|nr:MAG: hypothetical protein LQ340_006877 [Diploschistes diacapsis]